jgi:hypothetical protein
MLSSMMTKVYADRMRAEVFVLASFGSLPWQKTTKRGTHDQ